MDTCFEVAKSKTNLAVDIAANQETALYDCYCSQEITQAATAAGLKTFQAKLLVVMCFNITWATFHKDLAQNWVD